MPSTFIPERQNDKNSLISSKLVVIVHNQQGAPKYADLKATIKAKPHCGRISKEGVRKVWESFTLQKKRKPIKGNTIESLEFRYLDVLLAAF